MGTSEGDKEQPVVYMLAGPNGAGKSTLARPLLCDVLNVPEFLNADLIAAGLSPFHPESYAFEAAEIMLRQVDRMTSARRSFALETTLSGRSYRRMIPEWRTLGYRVVLYFLSLPTPDVAVERVAIRVKQGGHSIPEEVIRRRFKRGLRNFFLDYAHLADTSILFDSSLFPPKIVYHQIDGTEAILDRQRYEQMKSLSENTQ